MDIQLSPGSIASVREISDCGRRAFADDGLMNVLFPRLREPAEAKDMDEYLEQRVRKRMQSPNFQYVVATTVSSEGHVQLVGYALWVVPAQGNGSEQEQTNNRTGSGAEERPHVGEAEAYPRGMNIAIYNHVMDEMVKTKKEILGEAADRAWYLTSLAVDPAFKGRGIASKLVRWGTDRSDGDGLPAYLESSPAAVGVYERLGFKTQRIWSVTSNDQSYRMTVMLRIPGSSAET